MFPAVGRLPQRGQGAMQGIRAHFRGSHWISCPRTAADCIVAFSSLCSLPPPGKKFHSLRGFTIGELPAEEHPNSNNIASTSCTAHLCVCTGCCGLPGCPNVSVHTCPCQGLPVASRLGSGQARSSLYWGRPAWVENCGDWIGN